MSVDSLGYLVVVEKGNFGFNVGRVGTLGEEGGTEWKGFYIQEDETYSPIYEFLY